MKTGNIIFALFLSTVLINCDDKEKIEIDGDYFPMKENSEWQYLWEFFSTDDDHTFWGSDTVRNSIKGDTIFEGITYKKVVDQNENLVKVLRKQGGKYYGRNHELYSGFTNEYLFLDEEASLNSSWRHYKNDSSFVTEYKVKALNATRTYNNVEYHNVMELEVNYYYREGEEFVLSYSTLHDYVKGVGEIYASYPYPSMIYGDLLISLLKYNH
jgi:hypothetical protein